MALVKRILKEELKAIYEEYSQKEEVDLDGFADKIATAIDNYIKTATVNTTVTTTGTAAAQTGVGIGNLT